MGDVLQEFFRDDFSFRESPDLTGACPCWGAFGPRVFARCASPFGATLVRDPLWLAAFSGSPHRDYLLFFGGAGQMEAVGDGLGEWRCFACTGGLRQPA